jgi:hypothetical protein
LINSYLISKENLIAQGKRAYREFREELSFKLRNTPYSEVKKLINKRRRGNSMPAANQEALIHIRT